MKSAQLTGIRKIEIRDVPDPRIRTPEDVLIKVKVVGVCGSDVHYYATGKIGSQIVKYPFRVGHEFSGMVMDVGRAVKKVKVGDRIAVDPAMFCGRCDQCRMGRRHTCRRLKFLGCPGQAEGCFCEYIVMPESSCYKVPSSISMEEAALIEPLSIGCYSVKQSIPMVGAKIAILGCGPIGLSVLLPAKYKGTRKIYVTDKIDARLKVARAAGASWVGNPMKVDVVAEIAKKEPLLLDAVFECCGQQDAIDQAIELLKPGGVLLLIGIPTVDRISFCIDKMRRKEIRVQNIRRQNECVSEAIKLVAQKKVKPLFMISHRFNLNEIQRAFDIVENYRDGVVKAIITM